MNSDYNLAQYLFLGGDEEEAIDEHEQASNLISVRPGFSVVIQNDFVEQITDLREWLKTPWVVDNNNNADI